MSSDDTRFDRLTTRRKVLVASGSATMIGLTGCLGDGDDDTVDNETDDDGIDDGVDDDTGDDPAGPEEQAVVLLVEGVGGDRDYGHDGLSESEVDHACGHMAFDDPDPMEGGETEDGAPTFHDTHQPYEVRFEGDRAYVMFEAEDDDHGHDHDDDDNDEVSRFDVIDRSHDEVTADVDGDHWHGSLPEVPEGEHLSLGAYIEDDHGHEIELDGDHYALGVDLADGAPEGVVSFDHHGDHVHIIGEGEGMTEVVFQLLHDGHVDYETPSIPVEVVHGHGHSDDDNDDDHSHDDDDHDHGHGDLYGFFLQTGSVEVLVGEQIYEEHGVGGCDDIEMYVIVEPDHGEVLLELSP